MKPRFLARLLFFQKMKNLRALLPLLFLAIIGILGVKRVWGFFTSPVAVRSELQIFVIPKGSSGAEVAQKLMREGLIRNTLVFRLLLARSGLDRKIQAGDFRLSATMSAYQIAYELTSPLDIWITIPEGWRVEQIGEYLISNFQFLISNFKLEEFLAEAEPLEGYLFPDTYLVPKTANASAVIKILKSNFDRRFDEEMKGDAQKTSLSLEKIVNLASIVEREAKFDEDRPIVAGILIKRLKDGMPLQADATIQYAIATVNCRLSPPKAGPPLAETVDCNWWPKELTKADLELDSPYNTRRYSGLPPTPICNPGLASLKAVVYPKETDFWYYLSDGEGKMHYAVTLDEHVQNINTYLD